MSIALLFPGQGSQTPDMLHRLPDHPAIRQTLEEVSAELGYDAGTLDSPEALRSTIPVQLALLAAGVAAARALEAEGVIPEAVAGLSVGAFAAAVHAKVLTLADGIQLVKQRAELMEQHSPEGYGLTAIVGLNEDQVTALIREAVGRLPAAARDVRVHLHPEDAAAIAERLASTGRERAWSVVEDPTLTRGGCLVRSENSQIDARLESRVNAIVSSMLGEERASARLSGAAPEGEAAPVPTPHE